jgi:[protein-PII] uridylyltransferase
VARDLPAWRSPTAVRSPEQALDCIEQNLDRYTADDFAGTEAERQQLRALFYPRPGIYARLSEMHDCRLLNHVLPEFATVHHRVIRDFHHKYTVDEHTLLTHPRPRGRCGIRPRPAQAVRRPARGAARAEVLSFALLLHDIGKSSEANTRRKACASPAPPSIASRCPASAARRSSSSFRNHLAMSQVAFRRDLDDPHVVAQFAHLVGTEELLKMLCLMTLVDVEAVSSTTLTPWKEDLLWRLYVETYNHLTLGYGDELVRRIQRGLSVRHRRPARGHLGSGADAVPRGPAAPLSGALRALVDVPARPPRPRHPPRRGARVSREHDEVWELTIVTLDKPYLFSNIAGVLSYFGMDIHRGQAMTTAGGLVLDVFEFSDDAGLPAAESGATVEITRMLDRVVAGWSDVPALLRGRSRACSIGRRQRSAAAALRQRTLAEIHRPRARRRRRPGTAAPREPGDSRAGMRLDLALIATEGRRR